MIVATIAACEIGFWLFLGAGLVTRYLLRRPRTGAVLLVCVPLIDLVLLAVTVIDLRGGATADFEHGLAAAYIGFSVAFGHTLITRMDERFAHRFAGAEPPSKPPKYGYARARHEWRQFAKAFVAWAVSCGLLYAGVLLVGEPSRTEELVGWVGRLTIVLGIWALWPVTHTLWPSQPRRDEPEHRQGQHQPLG